MQSINTVMSKGTIFPNSLEYIDGDVTITDKFGVIRGTFVQNTENSVSGSVKGSFCQSNYSREAFKEERSNSIENEWEIIKAPQSTVMLDNTSICGSM